MPSTYCQLIVYLTKNWRKNANILYSFPFCVLQKITGNGSFYYSDEKNLLLTNRHVPVYTDSQCYRAQRGRLGLSWLEELSSQNISVHFPPQTLDGEYIKLNTVLNVKQKNVLILINGQWYNYNDGRYNEQNK